MTTQFTDSSYSRRTEPAATEADLIRATERERLRSLVEADLNVARRLHAVVKILGPGEQFLVIA